MVSERAVDRRIAEASSLPFTVIPAAPLGVRPRAGLRFLQQYLRGRSATRRLIRETGAVAMLATGGFVSGPAMAAAAARGIPNALIGLDAVPGKANRWAARRADAVFAAFPAPGEAFGVRPLPRAEVVGFPLRRGAVASPGVSVGEARRHFGLDPQRPTLLVFAGSQGARTINEAMIAVASNPGSRVWLSGGGDTSADGRDSTWQMLHVTGGAGDEHERVGRAYAEAGIAAAVLAYCDRMDWAWRAADLAITRAGAGTVAEAWANAVPCVMLPYPFHKDQHQRHNAAPLLQRGGAVVLIDRIDAAANLRSLGEHLPPLLAEPSARQRMRRALVDEPPRDGAQHLADWLTRAAAGGV